MDGNHPWTADHEQGNWASKLAAPMAVMARRLADLTGMIARALVLAATLGGAALAGASAEPGSPGPSDVIGYATLDPGAPSMTWSLPENKPYLYVPYVGAELNGAIATIRIGRDVGAALFQQPYFASRDVSCAPTLGSDGRPDLKWLGSTARLEPGAAGMEPDALNNITGTPANQTKQKPKYK